MVVTVKHVRRLKGKKKPSRKIRGKGWERTNWEEKRRREEKRKDEKVELKRSLRRRLNNNGLVMIVYICEYLIWLFALGASV